MDQTPDRAVDNQDLTTQLDKTSTGRTGFVATRRAAMVGGLAAAAMAGLGGVAAAAAAPSGAPPESSRNPVLGTSVRQYGAVGDGVHDDIAAIQRTIAAVQQNGGGMVVFPAGTYAVSAPITLTSETEWFSEAGILLVGEGEGSRIVRTDSAGTHSLVFFNGPVGPTNTTAMTGGYLRNCGMRNLAIGNSDGTAYPPGEWPEGSDAAVKLNKTIQFTIQDCVIEQPGGPGIELIDSYIGHVLNNIIRLNTDAITMSGVANALRFTNNRIQNNSGVGIKFPDNSTTINSDAGRAVTVYVAANDVEGNGKQGILFQDAVTHEAVTIIGNHFESNWQTKYGQGDGPFVHKTEGSTFFTGVALIGNRFLNFTPSEGAVRLEMGTNITLLSNSFVARGGGLTARDSSYIMGPGVRQWFAGPDQNGALTADTDVTVTLPTSGLVLSSEGGAKYRLTVANDGALSTLPVV